MGTPPGEQERVMGDMTKRFLVSNDFRANGLNKLVVFILLLFMS